MVGLPEESSRHDIVRRAIAEHAETTDGIGSVRIVGHPGSDRFFVGGRCH